jgi:histidine triad (HIT) family protein
MSEESCQFCRIVRKEAPASYVYEDEHVAAFLDTRPQYDGHTLVIPRRHYENIYKVPDEEVAHLFKIAKKVAVAVKKAVRAEGISITQHNESAAGQDVFHVHVHVIPRYAGRRLVPYDNLIEASRESLDDVARRIKEYL